jgi:hypothetical protein
MSHDDVDWDTVHRLSEILCDRIRDVLDPETVSDRAHAAIDREVTEVLSWVCRREGQAAARKPGDKPGP